MHTNTYHNRYHVVSLHAFTGVVITRMTEADEIFAAVGAAARFRSGDKDFVTVLQPADLTAQADTFDPDTTPTEPVVQTLEGNARMKRTVVELVDDPEYTAGIERMCPDGYWAALVFGRRKTNKLFEVQVMPLHAASWSVNNSKPSVTTGRKFDFSAKAAEVANAMPTGWTMLKTCAFIMGGIDCDCFPPTRIRTAATLLDLQRHERAFRDRSHHQRGRGVDLKSLYSNCSPEQRALLDQLIQQRRAAKAATQPE